MKKCADGGANYVGATVVPLSREWQCNCHPNKSINNTGWQDK